MGSIAFCLLSVLQLLVWGNATGLKLWLVISRCRPHETSFFDSLMYFLGQGYVLLQMLCGPSSPWVRVRRFLSRLVQQHSYFRTQRLLFSSEETRQHVTTPNNSMLLCAHPHGVLCSGWSVSRNPLLLLSRCVPTKSGRLISTSSRNFWRATLVSVSPTCSSGCRSLATCSFCSAAALVCFMSKP